MFCVSKQMIMECLDKIGNGIKKTAGIIQVFHLIQLNTTIQRLAKTFSPLILASPLWVENTYE